MLYFRILQGEGDEDEKEVRAFLPVAYVSDKKAHATQYESFLPLKPASYNVRKAKYSKIPA